MRAAIGWVGLVWLAPLVGSIAYICLGVNRIQRKAMTLRVRESWQSLATEKLAEGEPAQDATFEPAFPEFRGLAHLVHELTGQPLTSGNRVAPLINGDEAYPSMLRAIESAEHSVSLLTYIFDADQIGMRFLDALRDAQQRGVQVRVLIDDVGAQYSRPRMLRLLRQAGIPCAAFLPTIAPRLVTYANLRNHRKILVVDGKLGFTGGTNIREGHMLRLKPRYPAQCIHFELSGPVVRQLQEVFALDWAFASGESLAGPAWFPSYEAHGDVWARGIADGPDEDFEKLSDAMLGAIASAQYSIRIVTPYFLPETTLISALNMAAMKNVDVRIYLPERNNIWLVGWAMRGLLPQLLAKGCRAYWVPPPFDHTKLLVVDENWSLIGSTNWDPRSLRLNFEFNVECYSRRLAATLNQIIDEKAARSRPIELAALVDRPWYQRAADGIARLASPYL